MKPFDKFLDWLEAEHNEVFDWRPGRLHWFVLVTGAVIGSIVGIKLLR